MKIQMHGNLLDQIEQDLLDAVDVEQISFNVAVSSIKLGTQIAEHLGISRAELFRRCIDYGLDQINSDLGEAK